MNNTIVDDSVPILRPSNAFSYFFKTSEELMA